MQPGLPTGIGRRSPDRPAAIVSAHFAGRTQLRLLYIPRARLEWKCCGGRQCIDRGGWAGSRTDGQSSGCARRFERAISRRSAPENLTFVRALDRLLVENRGAAFARSSRALVTAVDIILLRLCLKLAFAVDVVRRSRGGRRRLVARSTSNGTEVSGMAKGGAVWGIDIGQCASRRCNVARMTKNPGGSSSRRSTTSNTPRFSASPTPIRPS